MADFEGKIKNVLIKKYQGRWLPTMLVCDVRAGELELSDITIIFDVSRFDSIRRLQRQIDNTATELRIRVKTIRATDIVYVSKLWEITLVGSEEEIKNWEDCLKRVIPVKS